MIYGFDIDGTICSTNCDYKDAEPYKEVIKEINHLYNQGHTIIFFTSRGYKSGKDWYNFTLNQINNWNVNYHKLIPLLLRNRFYLRETHLHHLQ